MENIRNIFNSTEKVIKLYNVSAKIISGAMFKKKYGTGLKILTPGQMFQRLQILLHN